MQKILIVKLGAIGDVLRTTSLLPGLEGKYYPAEIDWITSGRSKDILLHNKYIHSIWLYEERASLGNYDVVVGLEDDHGACDLVSRVKADKIIGSYLKNDKQTYTPSAWFDMSAISKYGLDKANQLKQENQKTYQQHMAELLGIGVSPYVFKLTPDEIEYGMRLVRGLGIQKNDRVVGINTGAGKRWPQKSWGAEQTIDLVKRLTKELGVVSLILGGEEERERNRVLSSETRMPDAGAHSLRHFASVINQCQAVLSSDSLAMHFAIALRKRVAAFFGPTSAAEIELYGLGEKLKPSISCITCYKKGCEIVPNCMDYLSVNDVFQAIKRQLCLIGQ
jgi:heptosyltransferase-2